VPASDDHGGDPVCWSPDVSFRLSLYRFASVYEREQLTESETRWQHCAAHRDARRQETISLQHLMIISSTKIRYEKEEVHEM
jgi:hypothetical protein